jgi:hypothetical protein
MSVDIFGRLDEQPLFTCENKIVAGCLGHVTKAYERLLVNLAKSRCKLTKIDVDPCVMVTVIHYTVEGTKSELAAFREAQDRE